MRVERSTSTWRSNKEEISDSVILSIALFLQLPGVELITRLESFIFSSTSMALNVAVLSSITNFKSYLAKLVDLILDLFFRGVLFGVGMGLGASTGEQM